MARDEYLIDSHIFMWAIDAPEPLSGDERRLLEDSDVEVAVSVASFWELSIKVAKGLLRIQEGKSHNPGDHFARLASATGFSVLSIKSPEAEYVRRLPWIHRDPFDRFLIAQALLGNRVVITRDTVFAKYPGVQVFNA